MSEFTIDIEKQLNKLGKDIQQMVGRIVPLEDKCHDFRPPCDIVSDLEDEEVYRRQERKGGVFSRSFALPQNVVVDEVNASFRTGVLTIAMPKVEDHEDSTNIPIN